MIATSAVNLREYNRIFTGTNQEFGYETPFVGFTSNTQELVLAKDKVTYFHYPIMAPTTLLRNSSLVYDGAIAGKSPYFSDRIWKKMSDYSSSSIWGNSQPIGKQTGIWLCSWLSGNTYDPTVAPVWKDRWYNPGYINAASAVYIENPLSSVVLDIDSQMILDGGSYYKFFHIGNVQNEIVVNTLSGVNNLTLHIENWSESPEDLSIHANPSLVRNFATTDVSEQGVNSTENPNDDCLVLNGTNYCETLYSSAIALTGNFTYSIWSQCEDWSKENNSILSKNHRGGYALDVDQGINTEFMVYLDTTGKYIIYNTEGDIVNVDGQVIISDSLPDDSHPTSLVIDEYNFTWVADNSAKKVYKIDYNGDILREIIFDATADIRSITLDSEKLWVLDSAANTASSFDLFNNQLSTTISLTGNVITSDLNDQILATSGVAILVDNVNNKWTVENGLVYKNNAPITSGDYIACDKDNNIWVLFDTNSFQKINASTLESVSGIIGTNTIPTDRRVDFAYEFLDDNWITAAYFTFANEQTIYKTDMNGQSLGILNLATFDLNPVVATFTAYDWNRKFNYLKYNSEPQFKATLFTTDGVTIQKHTVVSPISGFNNANWHMFTFVRNSDEMSLYIDGVSQDVLGGLGNQRTYFQYENSLILGADNGKIEPLRKELLFHNHYFIGKIDSLRMYDYALDIFDISSIYFMKYKFSDLIWNIPTGLQGYIEEIVRFFKFKPPGQKSLYYNINLVGLNITDEGTRATIEDIIKNTLKKVTPAYTELYKIIWK